MTVHIEVKRCVSAVLAMAIGLWPSVAKGQQDDGRFIWDVSVQKCQPMGQASCVLLGDQRTLGLAFGISSIDTVAVQLRPLAEAVTIRVYQEGAGEVPVIVDWAVRGLEKLGGDHGEAPDVAQKPLLLRGADGVRSSFRVRRSDGGPFGIGRYAVAVDVSDAFRGSVKEDGAVWRGRVPEENVLYLEIRQTVTRSDRIAYHRSEANYLVGERRFHEARPHLEDVLRLIPNDRASLMGLGRVLLELGMPADAAQRLEAILPTMLRDPDERPRQIVAGLLARSYVELRDEANARRVLRMAGHPEHVIQDTIVKLRKR